MTTSLQGNRFFQKNTATVFHRFVAYAALRCISAAYATKGHLTVTVNRHCIQLVKMLQQQHQEDKQRLGDRRKGDDWVFTQWNGEIMNPQTPTKQFDKFLKRHNLKHRKLHSLRHKSATLLLYGGINIRQVQQRLGHSEIETTQNYLYCISEADKEAVSVLADMLEPRRKAA